MRVRTGIACIAVATGLFGSSQGATVTEHTSGLDCQYHSFFSQSGAFQNEIAYTGRGIENRAYEEDPFKPAALSVTCPIHNPFTYTVSSETLFRVYYRDRNSMADNQVGSLSCVFGAIDNFGNEFFGTSKKSCATVGGCLSSDPAYTSPGGVATFLNLTGVNGQYRNVNLFCTIPRLELLTLARSGIIGIDYIYNPLL